MKAKFEKIGELTKRQIRLDSSNVPVVGNVVKFATAGEYPYGTLVLIKAGNDGTPEAVKYTADADISGAVFGIVSDNQEITVTEEKPVNGHVWLSGVFARDDVQEVTGVEIKKFHEIVANTQFLVFSKHI